MVRQYYQITMKSSARSGVIIYQENGKSIDIEYEISGVNEYDILLAPVDLRNWNESKELVIAQEKQFEILKKLREWVKEKNIKTDICLPTPLCFEKEKCARKNCLNNRIMGSAYCSIHYDTTLLKI